MNSEISQEVPKTKHHSMALASQMFMPTTYAEAIKFCELASKEDFVPTQMKNKPMALFLAWQMGASVGLDFFAAIQNIAVINGKPCIWGDAALAVIMNHPLYQEHDEWYEINGKRVTSYSPNDPNLVAFCSMTRRGQKPKIKSFSVKNAIQAKLWEKTGPWQLYPDRMLQMRARGFCTRDALPDALKGLSIREEIIDLSPEDYHVITDKKAIPKLGVHAVKQTINQIPIETPERIEENETINVNPETGEVNAPKENSAPTFEDVKKQIQNAKTVNDLIEARDAARCLGLKEEQHKELTTLYRKKQTEVKE